MKKLIQTLGLVGLLGVAGCDGVLSTISEDEANNYAQKAIESKAERKATIDENGNSYLERKAPAPVAPIVVTPVAPPVVEALRVAERRIQFKKYYIDEGFTGMNMRGDGKVVVDDFNNDGLQDIIYFVNNDCVVYENITPTNRVSE